eukprot:TRINITY_DN1090_c0_g2_i2.p1 TRINITY_DN1090_c0_g2~~TRINITY_DN1090_c0_g2_i2.p1  ORF type:complete len:128 (-),score=25.77 TRINITY_DN1090_c0_g2_i2:61-444(-)
MAGRGEEIETYEQRYKGDAGNFTTLDSEEGPGPARSVEGYVIFVTGVHEEAQEDELYDIFSKYGSIKNMHLNLDRRTGYVKGYALIEYADVAKAAAAIKDMNGKEILGKTVQVDWAFKKPPARKDRK